LRQLQMAIGNTSAASTGGSQLSVYSAAGPAYGTAVGYGQSLSFSLNSFNPVGAPTANVTNVIGGISTSTGAVSAYALGGQVSAYSLNSGYTDAFANSTASLPRPAVTTTTEGGSGKKKSSTTVVTPARPSYLTTTISGNSGGVSLGGVQGVGVAVLGTSLGASTNQGAAVGGTPSVVASSYADGNSTQASSAYALYGSFAVQGLGSGFSSFFGRAFQSPITP
jgi:hypothetical protein